MNHYPYQMSIAEPSQKQLWLNAYVALLTHLSPEEAVICADKAVDLCNERWASPPWAESWNYKHNYPVGHTFVPKEDKPS